MTMVVETDEKSLFTDEVLSGPVKVPGNAMYVVPQQEEFGSYEFMEDPTLGTIGSELVGTVKSLLHLQGRSILYFWKKKGGAVGGRPQRGKCLKPSGLFWQMTNEPDFIVWLASDHCAGMSKHEIEGTLFRQLCSAGIDQDGNRVILTPDVHEFRQVLERYGPLESTTKEFVKTARQLKLQL